MTLLKFLVPAAAAVAAFPAAAAVTVVGNSAARSCYEAAESLRTALLPAIATCDQALGEEPLSDYDLVATHVNRGILKLRRGDAEGAVEDFDAAIERDPNQAEAYLNKAVALMQHARRADAALPLFSAAIEKKTRRPALAYLGRGMAHEELGNLRSAYSDYRSASAADPKWKEPRRELARFQVKGR
jgi:tetratricopeptide (TPR) repeat protein